MKTEVMHMGFAEITPFKLDENVFDTIGKKWMLITAAKPDGTVNTMTAAWGGLGFIWQLPVAFLFIRPTRYTREFVEASSTLSLSFLPEGNREALNFLGTVSGRDDAQKIQKTGLTVSYHQTAVTHLPKASEGFGEGTPYFNEARLVLILEKLYRQDMAAEHFIATELAKRHYGDDDFHTMYIAAIKHVLVQE